jgi:hypothetical protein
MNFREPLRRHSTDCLEVASGINELLNEINGLLSSRPDVKKLALFNIKARGEQDQNRLQALSQYQGPDDGTHRMLDEYGAVWRQRPDVFWSGAHQFGESHNTPDVQGTIVSHYLTLKSDDK